MQGVFRYVGMYACMYICVQACVPVCFLRVPYAHPYAFMCGHTQTYTHTRGGMGSGIACNTARFILWFFLHIV